MKEAIIKFIVNLFGLILYVAFGTLGFYYGGFALSQALGFGFLFGLILGCLNEIRRDIWDFRRLFEKKNEEDELKPLNENANKNVSLLN